MIHLAVVNDTESLSRLRGPLEKRGIRARHVPVRGRTVDLTGVPPWGPDDVDVGYVYPGRTMEGGVADALLEVPWVNGRDAVLTSRNKAATIARLERAGVPVPDSVYVSNPVDDDAILEAADRIGWPVVVKPNSATRGAGVTRVSDPDSLLGVVDYLRLVHDFPATRDRSFLLQEFVPTAVDYRIMVVEGNYVGGVTRTAPGGWKHTVHRGARAESVDPPAPVVRLAEAAAEALDLSLAGVDLLARDDRVIVTETNARPTIDEPEKYEEAFVDRLAETIRDRAA